MYVSVKTAGAIAITAAEGGIGYWSQIDTYNWQKIEAAKDRKETFYLIRVLNADEDGYDEHPYAIDTELIQRGVNIAIQKGIFTWDLLEDGLEYMDSVEADVVVQYGLFGKLIYG